MRNVLVVSIAIVGCSSPKQAEPLPVKQSLAAPVPGECRIHGSGAVTFDQTDRDPIAETSYWLDDRERKEREQEMIAEGSRTSSPSS